MKKLSFKKGFTLIEILIVIGIIAILAAIVIVAINPARQFAQARNSQRTSNVNAILNAVGQRIADNKGLCRSSTDLVCTAAMDVPVVKSTITDSGAANTVNLRPCIVTTYMPEITVDPATGTPCADSACAAGYNTSYTIQKDATTQRITVCAPKAAESAIPSSVEICVTR